MASLITSLDPKSQALIEVVAAGYRRAGNSWPIWQYVDLILAGQGIDAEEVFRGLPTWQLNYRPAWTTGSGVPLPGNPIALTLHGMHHSNHPSMTDLGRGFVGALRSVARQRGELEPDPVNPVAHSLDAETLTTAANISGAVNLSPEQLGGVLQREPSTWHGYEDGANGAGSRWRFDVTKQARLAPYAEVTNTEGYLLVLEQLVGHKPDPTHSRQVLPPLAVPEALDHLDLTWRLATGLPTLLSVSSAGIIASLTQPAFSRDEFASRCSSLVDVIKQFDIELSKKKQHKLDALEETLAKQDGIEMAAARNGLAVLRDIFEVRNGLQHTGPYAPAEIAEQRLGLRTWEGNWEVSWNIVRAAAVDGLNSVRSSLRALIDDRTAGSAVSP